MYASVLVVQLVLSFSVRINQNVCLFGSVIVLHLRTTDEKCVLVPSKKMMRCTHKPGKRGTFEFSAQKTSQEVVHNLKV